MASSRSAIMSDRQLINPTNVHAKPEPLISFESIYVRSTGVMLSKVKSILSQCGQNSPMPPRIMISSMMF
jgi:hypothetical protein